MNKRQSKKRRNKFIALNDFPQKPFGETQCPYCGFDYLNYSVDEIKEMGGSYECKDYKSFFDGTYSGHEWTDVVKCPICKTVFENGDTDI